MTRMDSPTITVVIITTLVYQGYGYPSGAPLLACEQMKPFHPPTTTSGQAPFSVNMTSMAYKPGTTIKGVLYSPSDVKFRGFLIQVRSATDNTSTTAVGQFVDLANNSHTICGKGNFSALTHSDNNNKSEIRFTWKAPDAPQGDLLFRVTVVESYDPSRYWMGIFSAVASDCSLHPNAAGCNAITPGPDITTQAPDSGSTSGSSTVSTIKTTTTAPSNQIVYDKDCGITKGCFPKCPGGCEYLVTWQADTSNHGNNGVSDAGDTITFDIKMKLDDMNNVWAAVGFSPDGMMDQTNVAACVSAGSKMTIQSSDNVGYANSPFDDPTLGLELLQGETTDGVFHCSFNRQKSMNQTGFYDLTNDYYLLVGTGPVSQGVMQQHINIPYKSQNKLNFTTASVASENDSASTLVKVHASLMTIAWVFLSSLGLVAARHCKSMFGLKLYFKLKAWFVVHRTSMALVFACVIAATVAIFYEKGGFREITAKAGKEYTKAHPFMGLVVASLTVLNPLMALFRPSPESKHRYIFNWTHFTVGTSAHITAIITICFGLSLDAAKIKTNVALYVMIGYAVVFVLIQIFLEFYNRSSTQLKYGSISDSKQESSQYMVKRGNQLAVILLVHGCLMFVLAGILVVIIWSPSSF